MEVTDIPPKTQLQQRLTDIATTVGNIVNIDYSIGSAVGKTAVEALTFGNKAVRTGVYSAFAVVDLIQTIDDYMGNKIFGHPDAPDPDPFDEEDAAAASETRVIRSSRMTERQKQAYRMRELVLRRIKQHRERRARKFGTRDESGVNEWVRGV